MKITREDAFKILGVKEGKSMSSIFTCELKDLYME
jgi:hypothetical protein